MLALETPMSYIYIDGNLFQKHPSCRDRSGGDGGKFRGQQVPSEFMAITLVRLAMKVMSSGFRFLGERDIPRRSLVDRKDCLGIGGRGVEEVTEGRGEGLSGLKHE